MRRDVVGAFFCLFLNLACAPEFKDPGSASGSVGAIQAMSLDNYIKIQVQPSVTSEKYVVQFGWPKIEDKKQIRIRLDRTLAVVGPNQTDFNHEVSHNQVLTYAIDVLDSSSKIEKTFSRQVKIPRDFVVREGQSEFDNDTKLSVNRMFIGKDKTLLILDHKVEITANELISDGGAIATYPEGQKAKNDQTGKSGGELSLKVRVATGDLKIIMRGEDGGDGSKGPAWANRAQDGRSAGSGSLECYCLDGCPPPKLKTPLFHGQGPIQPLSNCSCVGDMSDGGPGQNGAKGNRGQPASPGGDSGNLKVAVQDGSQFNLQTIIVPGKQGLAGPGGDGQPAGLGGDGYTDPKSDADCRGKRGTDGHPGPPGDIGAVSHDGQKGLSCIYIASEGRNDCF